MGSTNGGHESWRDTTLDQRLDSRCAWRRQGSASFRSPVKGLGGFEGAHIG